MNLVSLLLLSNFRQIVTTKKGTEGTGLGLSITNNIVKVHDGALKVESKNGEGLPAETGAQAGTIFTIQLPKI